MSWQPRKLADCAKLLSGGTPKKSRSEYWDGNIPWVSSGEMTESFINDTSLHVTEDGAKNGTRRVPAGTILVVVRGMSLAKEFRISLTMRDMTFNQDLKALSCANDVHPKFLFYALKARKATIREAATDASHGTKKLDTDALASVEFPFPETMEEQVRVADIASAYDDLIEKNRRRIALIEQAARLMYREWFVHFRFPGFETTKFVDGLPEGWERIPFSEAAFVNQKTTWDKSKNRDIRMVPMGALSEAGMTCDSSQFERREKPTGMKFLNGDTLFARITPCLENGKTAYVDFLDENEVACGSTEFIVFRESKISRYMIYLLAREDGFRQNAATSMVGSSGRQRVQNSCFDKFLVSVPPNEIATEFDQKAEPMFKQIAALIASNHKLAKARDLLLPRLMDGRLPIPE